MKLASFLTITAALKDAEVRYLVAGGLAVNAHGYLRMTVDVDLVIQLNPENIIPPFRALATLRYRPRVPVTAEQFANAEQRETWISEKGMTVLNFHSDQHPLTSVYIFVTEPFNFDAEYDNALIGELAPGLFVRFISIPTLIAMKKSANRPRDIDDVQHLEMILEEKKQNE
jgi:hypothetical protein